MSRSGRPSIGPLAALALALAGPALAQSTAPGAAPAASAASRPRPSDTVERHIADLHRQLAITPAQQPQWDAFAAVMQQNAQRMQASYADRAARASTMNAVTDMRSYAELARAHAEDLQRLVPAFEALYLTMTPEQRANADKTFQQFQTRGERRRGLPG